MSTSSTYPWHSQKHKARYVGITLLQNQYELAIEKLQQAGLSRQVEIRLQDCRDVHGIFDRITSAGVFERVGIRHLPAYFSKMRTLLVDDGFAVNHGITTTDVHNGKMPYDGEEFIEKYVFPYEELPHMSHFSRTRREGGLQERDIETPDVENLRLHYARICSIWADNSETNAHIIRKMVDDGRFRIWRVYLAGCAYAFAQDRTSINQVVYSKAGRDVSTLPFSQIYRYC